MSVALKPKVEYVSVEQAAAIIGCTEAHIRYLLSDEVKELDGTKFNERAWAVEKSSAERYAKRPQTRGRPRISA